MIDTFQLFKIVCGYTYNDIDFGEMCHDVGKKCEPKNCPKYTYFRQLVYNLVDEKLQPKVENETVHSDR